MDSQPSLARRTAQFALAGFLFLLFWSLSTTVAYTLGRLKGAQSVEKRLDQPMLPLIVDPAVDPAVEPAMTRPASTPPQQLAVQPAPVPRPAPAPSASLYFQVGSLEKGMAEACKQYLEKNAFRVKVTPGAEPGVYRVLVGPLEPGAAVADTRAALESLGFRVFLRHL